MRALIDTYEGNITRIAKAIGYSVSWTWKHMDELGLTKKADEVRRRVAAKKIAKRDTTEPKKLRALLRANMGHISNTAKGDGPVRLMDLQARGGARPHQRS